jgi:hydrogenase expression/formation protein HypE
VGSLSVHGTLNDVAMMGAEPLYLTCAFILEEGLSLKILDQIVASLAKAAQDAGIPIVAGDTKVVERGKGDGIFITTTGIGRRLPGARCSGNLARPGDAVLVSGTLGDHAIALMAERQGLRFGTPVQSDSAALHTLVARLFEDQPEAIHVLRDPTRGGIGTSLNEIALQSEVAIEIEETALPIRPPVAAAAELLGLDPLYLANEGKMIVICDPDATDRLLSCLRSHPLGTQCARIGTVLESRRPFVEMITPYGGRRLVDWLTGEMLPRIC